MSLSHTMWSICFIDNFIDSCFCKGKFSIKIISQVSNHLRQHELSFRETCIFSAFTWLSKVNILNHVELFQLMMDLDTSQKSPIRYDTIHALKNVTRFDTDPQKVYLDTRYISNISILCTTAQNLYQLQM